MSRNQDEEATQRKKLDEAADKAQQVAEILDEVRAGGAYPPDEQPGGEADPAGGASEQTPGNGSKISPI